MTREEAIALLKGGREGVAKWNAWREQLPPEQALSALLYLGGADLSHTHLVRANLSGARLDGANFFQAVLSGADLCRADLDRADLGGAFFVGTDLCGAHLNDANLRGAHLERANLNRAALLGANLRGANLRGANLDGARLFGADLRGAHLDGARLFGADLSGASLSRTTLSDVDGRFTDFSTVTYVSAGWLRGLLMRLFTWQKVRSVGGLQILTKASYVMLALVPILAGVWQGVKVWAGQSRQEVSQAVRDLDHAAEHRRATASEPVARELEQVRAVTHRLQAMIDRGEFDHRLPSAWALGFFAALFVVAGHFVYQVRCPELVAAKTPDKFAEEQLAGFSSTADDRNDRLTRATNALRELAEVDPTRRHRNLVRRHGRVVWIPSELRFFDAPPEAPPEPPKAETAETKPASEGDAPARPAPRPALVAGGPELMRVAIEEGARAEYELNALRDRPSAVVAFLLYAAAGALIAWLVLSQSWGVARAAGWVG